MPELPEVETTVRGLNKTIKNLTIKSVWSDYFVKTASKRKDNIKNKKYFEFFRKKVVGEKIKNAERRGKNVLIHLTQNKTILVHMKMTGHLLYGKYEFENDKWKAIKPETLKDPYNRFVRLIFLLSNNRQLAFSDMRRFAKITLFETNKKHLHGDLIDLGPEPLQKLSPTQLKEHLNKKRNGKIKTVLMNQNIIAGIGNIYSDEILWQAGVHPERLVKNINQKEIIKILEATTTILNKSIKMGGDSMSDYRNIYGQKGGFQNTHKVYKRNKEKCLKKGCEGIIERKVIDGRGSHFCNIHQK